MTPRPRKRNPKTACFEPAEFDLPGYLKTRQTEVDAALHGLLPPVGRFPGKLLAAMRHSLFSGGKRLRPILVLAAAEACGLARHRVLPAACALECIHTYSLIHDDLPAMDDDDFRRGQPTCHKVFGEGAAILAGDALLTLAFELLAGSGLRQRLRTARPRPGRAAAERQLAALELIARAAGVHGMVGGQMADLEAEGQAASLPLVQFIHVHKTGKLMQASLLLGGLLAGATPAQQRALAVYGEALGLAFQITDDVLDVVGERARLGKNVGKDRQAGKATYPALFGVEESRRRARQLAARGIRALKPLGRAALPLQALAAYVVSREV